MHEWVKLSIRIGTFGFLKEFRPEDPYINQYLTGPTMNFTTQQVNQSVYPIATYVSLFDLILVFLLTDWLRYKPVIVCYALCASIAQAILIWCRSLFAIQIMEVFYGTMIACEVAYYTYIYAKVDPQHYQAVTSHMRAAALIGRFVSGMTAQLLLIFGIMGVPELNHLSLAGMIASLIWSFCLPSIKHSLYFHRESESVPCNAIDNVENSTHQQTDRVNTDLADTDSETNSKRKGVCHEALSRLWRDFINAYTNKYVLKWSIWWALATCGYQQVMSYVQILWDEIQGVSPTEDNVSYNGAIESLYTIISAFSAFAFGRVQADWSRPERGELLLGVLTLLEGLALLWGAHCTRIWQAYLVYIIFGALYHVMMTISNSEVARHLESDCYALIFGVNTFVALLLQTVLTSAVAAQGGFMLPIRPQYVVYGSYFCILGAIFLIKTFYSVTKSICR
ncbi:thiamine transporter 2 [Nilaparvata lugens]|uniref:thiamine transporter 2 n=1 Tax=Nilaparvata lugens TaxID=108931 RepID=UPI00193DA6A0|nr:thiamine transporter 2 [Nilaparvata lugens]